jgi:hypothetical protein
MDGSWDAKSASPQQEQKTNDIIAKHVHTRQFCFPIVYFWPVQINTNMACFVAMHDEVLLLHN